MGALTRPPQPLPQRRRPLYSLRRLFLHRHHGPHALKKIVIVRTSRLTPRPSVSTKQQVARALIRMASTPMMMAAPASGTHEPRQPRRSCWCVRWPGADGRCPGHDGARHRPPHGRPRRRAGRLPRRVRAVRRSVRVAVGHRAAGQHGAIAESVAGPSYIEGPPQKTLPPRGAAFHAAPIERGRGFSI
jgi:hypothetical protein